jgi:hypothetical protein
MYCISNRYCCAYSARPGPAEHTRSRNKAKADHTAAVVADKATPVPARR